MTGAPEGSLGIATKSGWINSGIFLEVLKHIQKKSSCSKDNPILLLVDNHESHVTIEAVDYARDNGIVYLSFPPHTTHRLQPLDVGIFGPFKAKLKTAFNDWHVNNPGKTLNIYNIPQLAKLAYFESFTGKNITSAFEKTGIWPFNKLAFSDDDFAAVSVYHSGSTSGPDVSVVQTNTEEVEQQDIPPGLAHTSSSLLPLPLEPAQGGQSSSTVDQGFPQSSVSASPPLPTPTTPPASLSAVTPEVVRPYPEVDRNAPKKSNKGRQPGKSRIYTDTPEKTRLEEIEKAKQLKKQELERKQKVKEMKRALSLSGKQKRQKKTVNIAKPKRQKKALKPNSENETDSEEGANVSLRESSCSPIQEMSEESDFQDETPVMSVNIKEGCFILVKFEKKSSFLFTSGSDKNQATMGDNEDFEDNQYPDNDEFVPYVTAGNLAQRNGAKVTVWGKVTKVSASEGFYVKTVDDQEILIKLRKPLAEPLEGWYEIFGVSQGKSILCEEYVPFSEEMTKNIDIEGHKGLAKLLVALDDPWNLGEDGISGVNGVVPME
ncbi:hypothetical protein MSG28_010406 [Choristoneura fumiferana]|uniref:Uncharacterized protein n=1 Tax=Choristoneura fumiferana TaxID=7141 RepID=A0ACC0KK93_CHOFU|nr:hypothetical protein MSG28_010406 [Choristoneura fumiferana]